MLASACWRRRRYLPPPGVAPPRGRACARVRIPPALPCPRLASQRPLRSTWPALAAAAIANPTAAAPVATATPCCPPPPPHNTAPLLLGRNQAPAHPHSPHALASAHTPIFSSWPSTPLVPLFLSPHGLWSLRIHSRSLPARLTASLPSVTAVAAVSAVRALTQNVRSLSLSPTPGLPSPAAGARPPPAPLPLASAR